MKMDWEKQALLLEGRTNANDWIIAKAVCRNCGKIYDFLSFRETKKCWCGGDLEIRWDFSKNWEKVK